jgi:hypothetical protein
MAKQFNYYDHLGMHKNSTPTKVKDGDNEVPLSTHESFDQVSRFLTIQLLELSETHPARKDHGLLYQWKLIDGYGRLYSAGFHNLANEALCVANARRTTVLANALNGHKEPPQIQGAKAAADMCMVERLSINRADAVDYS